MYIDDDNRTSASGMANKNIFSVSISWTGLNFLVKIQHHCILSFLNLLCCVLHDILKKQIVWLRFLFEMILNEIYYSCDQTNVKITALGQVEEIK